MKHNNLTDSEFAIFIYAICLIALCFIVEATDKLIKWLMK